MSDEVLAEYADVLSRPKFSFGNNVTAEVMALFRDRAEHASADGLSAVAPVALPDPDDAAFLRCALGLGADCIVTGNKRHFPAEACGHVRIVNARELLDWIADAL